MHRTQHSRKTLHSLAGQVARLSRLLTKERDRLPAAYLNDPDLREAYRAYFLPPNAGKIRIPLSELDLLPEQFPARNQLSVLDLGTGPGSSLAGVLDYFSGKNPKPVLSFTAVDQVRENLAMAEDLFAAEKNRLALRASLITVHSVLQEALPRLTGSFDLIILSNVLNELFSREGRTLEKRLALLGEYLHHCLAEHGACIIIEPALRETSRELLQVRDGLLQQGYTIFAPCLCHGPCPALENPKDWCHEDRDWDAPDEIRELDAQTGLRKDSLKFSYVTVRKDGRTLADITEENAYRVVSERLATKGKSEYFLCGRLDRRLVVRLDKDRTPANEPFGSLRRGDIAKFSGLIDDGKRYKVGRDTRVTRYQGKP